MTVVIKGGTIVTADLTYKADILIDGDTIALRSELCTDPDIDCDGCSPFVQGSCDVPALAEGSYRVMVGGVEAVILRQQVQHRPRHPGEPIPVIAREGGQGGDHAVHGEKLVVGDALVGGGGRHHRGHEGVLRGEERHAGPFIGNAAAQL
jgi:hypothetical protein